MYLCRFKSLVETGLGTKLLDLSIVIQIPVGFRGFKTIVFKFLITTLLYECTEFFKN